MEQAQPPREAGDSARRSAAALRRPVLLVGATASLHADLSARLRAAGHAVEHLATGQEVLARDRGHLPALILCEPLLPDMFGVLLCNALRRDHPDDHIHFILMGEAGTDPALAVQSGGVDDVLPLPVHDAVLRLRLAVAERMLTMANELTRTNRGLAQTLENLRATQKLLDRDLAEARRLQQGLVRDRYQEYGPTRISLLLRPSGHVGGDLVGTFPICRCRRGIYAIDVAGHGVTAALVAARVSAWLSRGIGPVPGLHMAAALPGALAPAPGAAIGCGDPHGPDCVLAAAPAEVVGRLNRMMLADAVAETYFTMIYAELNTVTGDGLLVQAGHPSPILQSADGAARLIGDGGLPVGLFEEAEYAEIPFRLHAGERLFIASDGLTEAESPRGDLLGDEGLLAAMRMNAGLHGQAFIESLCWSVSRFAEGRQEDDISAVLIERGADAALEGAA